VIRTRRFKKHRRADTAPARTFATATARQSHRPVVIAATSAAAAMRTSPMGKCRSKGCSRPISAMSPIQTGGRAADIPGGRAHDPGIDSASWGSRKQTMPRQTFGEVVLPHLDCRVQLCSVADQERCGCRGRRAGRVRACTTVLLVPAKRRCPIVAAYDCAEYLVRTVSAGEGNKRATCLEARSTASESGEFPKGGGSSAWTRTRNPPVNSRMLYH
jgi:hypothetical protein